MRTLNIWEVRAESGKKEPFLDVAENVMADTFVQAQSILNQLICERINQNPEHFPLEKPGDEEIRYSVTCIRLIQQVKTL